MHTPGPWHVTGRDYIPGRVVDGRGFEICAPAVEHEEQGFANARLIAAAPQLLEAMRFTEEAAAFIAALLAGGPTLKQVYLAHDELMSLRDIARAAIEAAS